MNIYVGNISRTATEQDLVLGPARNMLSDGILGRLEERSELHQTGKGPRGPGAQPEFPDGSGCELKSVTMTAPKLRTQLDTTQLIVRKLLALDVKL